MTLGEIIYFFSLIGAYIVGFLSEFFMKIVSRRYEEYRDKVVQKRISRGDLACVIRQFCDIWEDREYLIPYTNLREEIVDRIKNIRERARDAQAELSEEDSGRIRGISGRFLRIAKRKPRDNDEIWSEHVRKDMNEVCQSLKEFANELLNSFTI